MQHNDHPVNDRWLLKRTDSPSRHDISDLLLEEKNPYRRLLITSHYNLAAESAIDLYNQLLQRCSLLQIHTTGYQRQRRETLSTTLNQQRK